MLQLLQMLYKIHWMQLQWSQELYPMIDGDVNMKRVVPINARLCMCYYAFLAIHITSFDVIAYL